jgi:ADP-L-glycero-D-manno-heptose 6-epimerase
MILVTGGAGFIGSVLVRMLGDEGIRDVVVVDRLGKNENWQNLKGAQFVDYIHADDLFGPLGKNILAGTQVIFHMGACSCTTETDMDYLWKNNVLYSRRLFEWAAQKKIPFIYASSAATYGNGEQGYSDEHSKIQSLLPLNRYGLSKHLFDQWALAQKKRPSFWAGLKFFNVFGPNEGHKEDMSSLVYKAYYQIKDSKKVSLFKSHRGDYEDGGQLRDFVYVKDVCRAMLLFRALSLKKNTGKHSGIYNMGTGTARSFKELASFTFKAMQEKEDILYFDMPKELQGQYQYFTQAEMGKFSKLFPKFKFTPLEKAVADYVQNHLANKVGHY